MTAPLSPREIEVLDLISHGLTTKEIAMSLFLSDHTIISHRKSMLLKMDVKNTAGLVRKAFEYRIISLNRVAS